jgi:hypothetical protein
MYSGDYFGLTPYIRIVLMLLPVIVVILFIAVKRLIAFLIKPRNDTIGSV